MSINTKAQVKNILGAFHQVFKEIDYKKQKNLRSNNRKSGESGYLVGFGARCSKVLGKKGIALKISGGIKIRH